MPENPEISFDKGTQDQLARAFEQMPHKVPIYLFAEKGQNDIFSNAARQVIQAFQQITDRITFKEYDLDHKLARKWDVDRSPTILFDPDRYAIRWLGAPLGEEGRTFLEALLLIGFRTTGLGEQALKILQAIDSPRDIKVFVSASCPYCPQQAVNALKAAIINPERFSLEIIDIQCNPDLADQYAAQGVPQTYSNDMLIAQGAQSEELFVLSLQKMEQQTLFIPDSDAELIENDLVVVGGGPAGLTAGIYAVRSGLSTALIERVALGGQVATTPIVENYPGFNSVGGKSLVDILVTHALEYVKIFQGEEVVQIEPGDPINVVTSRRKFQTRAVLLATGASHKRLGVPGEDRLSGRGVSYCSTCDGPLFKDKKVVMLGGGDSAVTEALHLRHIGMDVTLIHRRDTLRAQQHLVKNLADNNIPVIWNTEVREIRGEGRVQELELYNNKTETGTTMEIDGVFVAIGYTPAVDLAQKIGVELTPEGYIKRDNRHRTNIPGIYSAGDVEGGFKQIVTAAGQGAEAALSIFEDLINPYWKQEPARKRA
ncbi:FAD-dependent oxidoreductase [Thermodesulfobacteriota bacterium]